MIKCLRESKYLAFLADLSFFMRHFNNIRRYDGIIASEGMNNLFGFGLLITILLNFSLESRLYFI